MSAYVYNGFFTAELKVADEHTCQTRWLGGNSGQYFRCCFCGYKFSVGDKYRVIYTNDISGAGGNPIVCEKCNDSTDALRQRWTGINDELNSGKYWWFFRK